MLTYALASSNESMEPLDARPLKPSQSGIEIHPSSTYLREGRERGEREERGKREGRGGEGGRRGGMRGGRLVEEKREEKREKRRGLSQVGG